MRILYPQHNAMQMMEEKDNMMALEGVIGNLQENDNITREQKKADRKISLEQSLAAYRCVSTDKTLTWKQNYVNEHFSDDNILACPDEEKRRFASRLEFPVTIARSIRQLAGEVRTGKDLMGMIVNPAYEKVKKTDRQVVFSTGNGERPQGKNAFLLWNGWQVIDMDIKDREIAGRLKGHIFHDLKKYNWFLGVAFSSSGKGLHIYTKIQIPESDDSDLRKKKILYFTNFRHKYSFVYLSCRKILGEIGKTEDDLLTWMDLSMFRPAQGAFIPYDPQALISSQFFEDFIYVCFDNVEDMGDPDVDWVSYPALKKTFRRWEWFENGGSDDDADSSASIGIESAPELDTSGGIARYHYKHAERWKLANTLVQIYGLEKGYRYMRMICSADTTDKELQGDCATAARHNKSVDPWAISRLNKYHGFKIKSNVESAAGDDLSELHTSIESIDNPLLIYQVRNVVDMHITKDQYLGDIKKDILSHLGQITLIEAGAGVGKTEMVKSIAREGKRVLMIMPFTSTIKSKVEGDDVWDYSYGNRKVDLYKSQCIAMTIDKFSRISLLELKDAAFDYVFIDESHLLFQSEYRPVMPKVIDMIKHSEVPIIMMSGTPIGETVFFPELVHIRVKKDDVRKKEFNVVLTEDESSMFLDMCRSMARDVCEGRRVLFPTNKGSLYKEQVQAAIQYFCDEEFHERMSDGKFPVVVNYYKKSNVGDEFMDSINKDKTIGKTDVLLCSNYLSVGVDINDRYVFSVYLNDLWLAQEIEQFANRLRSNDLYIHLYQAKKDAEGNPKPLFRYRDINLRLNVEELKGCQAILRLCNAMIERSPMEYKYNSLISSIIYNNKFIEYNDVENKYYLNETAYKVIMFERKYREFAEQLPVIVRGMQNYGYDYHAENRYIKLPEGFNLDALCDKKKQAREALRLKNTDDVYELINLITEDRLEVYRDAMRGRYDERKGKEWRFDEDAKIMWVKNVEVFEKVVPIFLSLTKIFELDDIRGIFEYCRKTTYNFSAIKRIRTLANILYNDKRNRLDIRIKEYMKEIDRFVEEHKEAGVSKQQVESFIKSYAMVYARQESGGGVPVWMSSVAMEELQKSLTEVFKCLVDLGRVRKSNLMSISKCEMLWQEKTDSIYKFNDQAARDFILGDMMDFDVKKIDINYDSQEDESGKTWSENDIEEQ